MTSSAPESRQSALTVLERAAREETVRRRIALGYVLGIGSGVVAGLGLPVGLIGSAFLLTGTLGGAVAVGVGLAMIAPAFVIEKWRTDLSAELRMLTDGSELLGADELKFERRRAGRDSAS